MKKYLLSTLSRKRKVLFRACKLCYKSQPLRVDPLHALDHYRRVTTGNDRLHVDAAVADYTSRLNNNCYIKHNIILFAITCLVCVHSRIRRLITDNDKIIKIKILKKFQIKYQKNIAFTQSGHFITCYTTYKDTYRIHSLTLPSA